MTWVFSYNVFLTLTWSYSCIHSVRWKFEKSLALIYLGKLLLKRYYNSPEYSRHSSDIVGLQIQSSTFTNIYFIKANNARCWTTLD